MKAGCLESLAKGRGQDACSVGSLHGEFAQRSVPDRERQTVDRGLKDRGVVAPGQKRPAASLDVQREPPINEDH